MSVAAAPAVVREVVPLSVLEADIDIRPAPMASLPPDIAYCLDAEVELGAISADERAYVDLFDDDTVGWFEGLAEGGADLFVPTIKARFAAWREWAAPGDRLALDWAGLRGMRWRFDEVAKEVAYAASRDGGPSGTLDAQSRIGRALMATRDAAGFIDGLAAVVARTADDVAMHGPGAFAAAADRCEALYRDRSAPLRRRDEAVRAWAASLRRNPPTVSRPAPQVESRRDAKRRVAGARRVLRRSYALLESVAGRHRARACLSGDTVTVEGRRFDFRLRVPDPKRSGALAVDVSVTDKHGIELASLCVYNPGTPAFDQVVALILHVVSGQEDAIVRTGNVVRSTEAATRHAAFLEVRGLLDGMPPGPDHGGFAARADGSAAFLRAARTALAEASAGAWAPLAGLAGLAPPWVPAVEFSRNP